MIVKLLTEHHLEFLSLKGGCTGLSEPTLVKLPHCWKSRVMAQLCLSYDVASGSEITPCNEIDKPLVVYRFTGKRYDVHNNVVKWQNYNVFTSEMRLQRNLKIL